MQTSVQVKLIDARLSFPSLFKPSAFDEDQEPKYSATFLLDKVKDKEQIANFKKTIAELLKAEGVDPKSIKVDKFCIQDGDGKDYDGYAGMMSVKASGKKRPTVVNRDRSPVTENDNIVYAGCYVNAVITLYCWEHKKYGKGVSAWLNGVQFSHEGEAFGVMFDADKAFEDISDISSEHLEKAQRHADAMAGNDMDEADLPF